MIKNDKVIGNNVLKILIVHHTMPDIPGFTTKMFDGVLPILKKYLINWAGLMKNSFSRLKMLILVGEAGS